MPHANTLFRAGALAGATLLLGLRALAAQAAADSLVAAERKVSEASGRGQFAGAFVAALAEDGAILWPGAPVVHGAGPVRKLLSAQRLLDSLRITWEPLGAEVSADGTIGMTWGVSAAGRDGAAPHVGRYITAWRRESGAWKIAAFVGLHFAPLTQTILPPDVGPLRLPSLPARGAAAAFITADLAFSRLAGDSGAAVAFQRYAAPDGFMLAGGMPQRGPAAIREVFEGGPPTAWAWHPVLAGASASGDLGYTVGEAVVTPQGAPARYSKYLTIWRRLPNGTVRFLTDGGTPRPDAP